MTEASALYRRYRPDTFADVIGQEHVTTPLMTALKKNRVNHAYLFSGPRGCGKTTSARILARCLNCEQGPTDTPCGVCPSCVELARGGAGSLDVIEIDAASHGGVDDARDLRERATFAPARDRYKIFIIDEAHMVTSAGFNALLKIVEEPPEHIKFIFATTEPDKVIGTIRSRTHHYPFRLVPPEPLMAYLELLCQQENVQVAPGVLALVIRAGGGSVRDSLSVLDQLMAGASEAGIDYELAVSLLGYTHASLLDDVVDAVAAHDSATVFRAVDRVLQTGHDPRRFVEDVLERFRDLIIVKALPDSAESILRGMPADQIARMRQQANLLGANELSRAADITNAALSEMTGATSPRLHLELLCARIMLPAADHAAQGAQARIDALERRLALGGVPAQAASVAAAGSEAVAPAEPAGSAPAEPAAAAPTTAAPTAAAADAPAASASATGSVRAAENIPARAQETSQAVAVSQGSVQRPDHQAVAAHPNSEQRPQATPAPEPQQTAPAAPGPAGAPVDVDTIRRAWPQITDRLGKLKRSSWALVAPNASVAKVEGATVVLAFPTPGLTGAFARGDHREHVQTAIREVLDLNCKVDAITGDSPVPASSAPGSAAGQQAPRSAPSTQSAPPAAASPADQAAVEEPPGWDPDPKPSASRNHAAPVSAPGPGDFGPRDEDVPPLEEEPPYFDEGPMPDFDHGSAPDWAVTPPVGDTVAPSDARPASARPTSAGGTRSTPGSGTASNASHPATATDDPWSRAREQSPGKWSVSSESNVRERQSSVGSTAGPTASSAADTASGSTSRSAAGFAADTASGSMPTSTPGSMSTAGSASTAGPGPASSPESAWPAESGRSVSAGPGPELAPAGSDSPRQPENGSATSTAANSVSGTYGTPAARADAAGSTDSTTPHTDPGASKSLYQRLQSSPEAQRARETASQRSNKVAEPTTPPVQAGYMEDEISADDETIEQSAVFGRAAVERLLDGQLLEETDLDGNPIIRR